MKLFVSSLCIVLVITKTKAFTPTTFVQRDKVVCFASTPSNKPVKSEPNQRIYDYMHRISSLSSLLNLLKDRMVEIKEEIIQLKNLEESDPSVFTISSKTESFKRSLAEVKATIDSCGPNSPEAKIAWDHLHGVGVPSLTGKDDHHTYNEKALHTHHNYNAVVDTAMLLDAISALEKIESIANFIDLENDILYNFIWKEYQDELSP